MSQISMVLIDTSIWINHFRDWDRGLSGLINAGLAATHPFVIGELAAGGLTERPKTIGFLSRLPGVFVADHEKVMMMMVEVQRLHGLGLSWVDLHLLASARLSNAKLFTADRALKQVAEKMGVAH